eukprot:COSAG01_NODE_10258_length_2208_cov_1.998578_4_plen_63_part_01
MDQDARQLLTLDAYVRACSSLQRRLVWRKRQKSTRPSTSLRLEERKEVAKAMEQLLGNIVRAT